MHNRPNPSVEETEFKQSVMLKEDDGTFEGGACATLTYQLADALRHDNKKVLSMFTERKYSPLLAGSKASLFNFVNPAVRDGSHPNMAFFERNGQKPHLLTTAGRNIAPIVSDEKVEQAFITHPTRSGDDHQLLFARLKGNERGKCMLFDPNKRILKGSCSQVVDATSKLLTDIDSATLTYCISPPKSR